MCPPVEIRDIALGQYVRPGSMPVLVRIYVLDWTPTIHQSMARIGVVNVRKTNRVKTSIGGPRYDARVVFREKDTRWFYTCHRASGRRMYYGPDEAEEIENYVAEFPCENCG